MPLPPVTEATPVAHGKLPFRLKTSPVTRPVRLTAILPAPKTLLASVLVVKRSMSATAALVNRICAAVPAPVMVDSAIEPVNTPTV